MSTFEGWIEGHGHTIRIDRFTNVEGEDRPAAYLLSHAHSDHFVGLTAQSMGIAVYCTRETAELVAHNATAQDRIAHQVGFTSSLDRPFLRLKTGGLRRRTSQVQSSPTDRRDGEGIFRYLEYDVSRQIDVGNPDKVVMVTAIDANHSPGSAMFLIETLASTIDSTVVHAALYTGDLRCDSDYVDRLRHHRLLQRYIAPEHRGDRKGKGRATEHSRLDCIYLDTSGGFSTGVTPSKSEGMAATLKLLDFYPPGTKYYFSTWTTGYETMFAQLAGHLGMPIHVDQHAYRCFRADGVDPSLLTTDLYASPTLLHACGKQWRCDEVWSNGVGAYAYTDEEQKSMRSNLKRKRNAGCGCAYDDAKHLGVKCRRPDPDEGLVVFVNGVEPFTTQRYADYHASMVERLEAAQRGDAGADWPANIIVPFARHSVLPELRAFVCIFAPASLHPNTIYDQTEFVDYYALPRLYGDLLPPAAIERIQREAVAAHRAKCRKDRRPFKPRYHFGTDSISRSLDGYWLRDSPESREALRGVADNFVGGEGDVQEMLEVLGAVPSTRVRSPKKPTVAPMPVVVRPTPTLPKPRLPLQRGGYIVQNGTQAVRVESLSGSQLASMSLPASGLAGQHRLERHAAIVASASAPLLEPNAVAVAAAPIVSFVPSSTPPRPLHRALSREHLAELDHQPRSPPAKRRVPTWAHSVRPSTASTPPQPLASGSTRTDDDAHDAPRTKRPKHCRLSGDLVPPRRADQSKADRPPDSAAHVAGRSTDVFDRYLNNMRRTVRDARARFLAKKAAVVSPPSPGFQTVSDTTDTMSTARRRTRLAEVTEQLFAPRDGRGLIGRFGTLNTP